MFFGSKYVYKYEHSSDESVSDDDDEVKANITPMLALANTPTQQQQQLVVPDAATVGVASTSHKRRKHLRKADTNVLSVRFNRLLQPGKYLFFNNK